MFRRERSQRYYIGGPPSWFLSFLQLSYQHPNRYKSTILTSNSTQQSSSEACSRSASQGIPTFYRTRGSLPCSQVPATCSNPEPDESISHLHIHISLRPSLILSSHLCLGLSSDLFPTDFPTKILYAIFMSHACCVHSHKKINFSVWNNALMVQSV